MKMGFLNFFKKKKEAELPPVPKDLPNINTQQSNVLNQGKTPTYETNKPQQVNQQVNIPQIPSLSNKPQIDQQSNLQSQDLKGLQQSAQEQNLAQNILKTSQNQSQIMNSNQLQSEGDNQGETPNVQSKETNQGKASLIPTHYIENNTLFLELNNYKNFRSYFEFVKQSFEALDQAIELSIENEDFENSVSDFIKNIEEMNRTILQIDKKYFYE